MASSKWKMSIMLFVIALFFIPLHSTYAEEISREDLGKDLLSGMIGKSGCGPVKELTDGDDKTSFTLSLHCSAVYYTLDSPVRTGGYYYFRVTGMSNVFVAFVFKDGNSRVFRLDGNSDGKLIQADFKDVVGFNVILSETMNTITLGSVHLYEYKLKPPKEVSNLEEIVSHDFVKFTYSLPKENFSHLKIYRDGKLIANDVKIENFVDKDVASNQEYLYKFVTISPEGADSKGIEKKVKTSEKPNLNKPAKPPNPNVTSKDGSLLIGLTNYNAGVPIKGYHIYIDGKKMNDALVTSRSYYVNGLKNNQTYEVKVKAVSKWDIESDFSNGVNAMPQVQVIPDVSFNFGLSELIQAIKNWFDGIWGIVAFSIVIPLAFIIAVNTKKLFLR